MRVKNLVVGAGLSGITLAQCLAQKGEQVFIVEKRNHIGGNCYDYYENGILVHKYGPHIFHTDIEEVRDYVNRFSEFTDYHHKVLGLVDGNLVPIPFNLNSIHLSFLDGQAGELEKSLLKYFDFDSKVTIGELRDKSESVVDKNLSFLADYIFENVFKNYTMKQWGISADEMASEVMERVPVVISRNNHYFSDQKYQGMPKEGYTTMFEKMLDNENIRVMLDTDYKDVIGEIEYEKLYVTSPIDEFFDNKYGELGYRKTLFKFETEDVQSFQENSVINYPNDYERTRITEFKKFYPLSPIYDIEKTVILKEYPGIGDIKSYPIGSQRDKKIFEKYNMESKKLKNVYFFGRLGNYKYRDMDKVIKNVLDFFN